MHFWNLQTRKQMPLLAAAVQEALAAPQSSIVLESVFSLCRRVLSDSRGALRDDRLLALVALKFNKIALLTCPKDGVALGICEESEDCEMA